jgi:hypothetical protein
MLRTTLAAALLVAPGCNQLNLFLNADLEFAYLSDDTGRVERASVSTGTRVIATARRSSARETADPDVTEIDVDETHFVRAHSKWSTPDRSYFGAGPARVGVGPHASLRSPAHDLAMCFADGR